MIKLIISDLDGTLIGKDELMTDEVMRLVARLRDNGIMFTIATGRVEEMAYHYIEKLGIDIPYIACNGATIMNGTQSLARHPIPLSPLKKIIELATEMNLSLIYTIDGKEYVAYVTSWIENQRKTFSRYFNERPFSTNDYESLKIDKITIMDDVRDGRISLIEDLSKEISTEVTVTRYVDKAIEIVDKNSNKGSAVKFVAEYLNISLVDIMAIGDHQNDIEVLKEVGLGVAVGNALQSAKDSAKYVATKNCYEGVIEAVNKFCFKEAVK